MRCLCYTVRVRATYEVLNNIHLDLGFFRRYKSVMVFYARLISLRNGPYFHPRISLKKVNFSFIIVLTNK